MQPPNHSQSLSDIATPLSHHAQIKVAVTVHHAWKSNTRSKYKSGIRNFNMFCDREGIANHFRLPASEHLLCAFAASLAGE
jgi:hypothetical protein